jgi:hypothetical protein
VSAYALRSAVAAHDSLDPEFYNANAAWRRLSFTLGADFPQDGGNAQAERGVIAGAKYLLYNRRDITADAEFGSRVEQMLIDVGRGIVTVMEDPIVEGALAAARCSGAEGDFIDASKIDNVKLQAIDAVIEREASAALAYQEKAAELAREVNNRPQVSVQFLTNQRQGDATNNYKGSLIGDLGWNFDLGFADTMALTFNGAYVYDEQGGTEADGQGGMIGAKLRMFQSPTRLDRRVPWTLSLASDAAWKTNETPQYRVQGAISIALWDGVDLPISVAWARHRGWRSCARRRRGIRCLGTSRIGGVCEVETMDPMRASITPRETPPDEPRPATRLCESSSPGTGNPHPIHRRLGAVPALRHRYLGATHTACDAPRPPRSPSYRRKRRNRWVLLP